MGESFLICGGLIAGAVVVLALILGAIVLRCFIAAAITGLISAGLFYAGFYLLFTFGGEAGAFGLFLMLPGAFFGWLSITFLKMGIAELDEWRR